MEIVNITKNIYIFFKIIQKSSPAVWLRPAGCLAPLGHAIWLRLARRLAPPLPGRLAALPGLVVWVYLPCWAPLRDLFNVHVKDLELTNVKLGFELLHLSDLFIPELS